MRVLYSSYLCVHKCVCESFGGISEKFKFIVVTCETWDKSEVRWEGLHDSIVEKMFFVF